MLHEAAYTSTQTANIVGITYRQLDYWDRSGFLRPSIRSAAGRGKGKHRLYSEYDLLALRIAKRLKDERLSLRKIRAGLEYLQRTLPDVLSPLSAFTFLTDGSALFMLTDNLQTLLDTTKEGQFVIKVAVDILLRDLCGRAGQEILAQASPQLDFAF